MQFHEHGSTEPELLAEIDRRLAREMSFESGRILGCMCSEPDEIAKSVFARYAGKNAGDPGLFGATAELEREAIAMIAELLQAPRATGSLLTGGTEANILALLAARRRAGPARREVIVPESAHYSFDKAAELMGLELVRIPLTDSYTIDARLAEQALSNRTMAIVGVAGTTALGAVDPIDALSAIAVRRGVPLHVDAAFGGFVLPFLRAAGYPTRDFDFSLSGVSSITIDPHKMGRSAIPAGCLMFRDEELARAAETPVSYLTGGETLQRTIVGTRSGAAVIAVWAVLRRLGRRGYTDIVRRAMELAHWFADEVARIPDLAVVAPPTMNVLGVRSRRYEAHELAERLRLRGWAVASFDQFIRIVIMPHLDRGALERLLDELADIA